MCCISLFERLEEASEESDAPASFSSPHPVDKDAGKLSRPF